MAFFKRIFGKSEKNDAASSPAAEPELSSADPGIRKQDEPLQQEDEHPAPVPCEASGEPVSEEELKELRKWIIQAIKTNPQLDYQLSSLLWQDAADCFPNGPHWDGVWFKLDLKTRELRADVSTYPNHLGAYREYSYPLTAAEFHEIVKKHNWGSPLESFVSDEDWAALFDDTLEAAVAEADQKLQIIAQEKERENIRKNAVKLTAELFDLSPKMEFTKLFLELDQRYARSEVTLTVKEERYHLEYKRDSKLSPDHSLYKKDLSSAESVWVEEQIDETLRNTVNKPWESLPGGDRMSVVISKKSGNGESLDHVMPIRRYLDLMHELERLAQYGSLS